MTGKHKRTDNGIMESGAPISSADTHWLQVAQSHWSQVVQSHYNPDGNRELTTVIVHAIAEAEGVSPTEVTSPPIYEVVDVPAVEDAVFRPEKHGNSRQGFGIVEFRYTDYIVKVRSDGWIQVYEPTE